MKARWYVWGAVGGAAALALVAVVHDWIATARLKAGLTDQRPAVRAAAVRKWPHDGDPRRLIERLRDEDADVRFLAVTRLGGTGRNGAERARALASVLNDGHAGVCEAAAHSLGGLGPEAWPVIRAAFDNEDPRVREGAARALFSAHEDKSFAPWLAQHSAEIISGLEKLLTDPDPDVRRRAGEALDFVRRARTKS